MAENKSHKPRLGLQTTLTQKPVMTPQLQQAIRVLNFTAQELSEYVEAAMQNNPLLEYGEDKDNGSGGDKAQREDETPPRDDKDSIEEPPPETIADSATDDAPVIAHAAGSDMTDGFAHASNTRYQGRARFDEDYNDIFDNLSAKPDLREHLRGQIGIEIPHPTEQAIAYKLLDLLESSGWISEDWQDLHKTLGVSAEQVEAVLMVMQEFDPPGVLARNLRECLALQLREYGMLNEAMECLLDNLEDLTEKSPTQFSKLTGLSADEVVALLKIIRSLEPKPGSLFNVQPTQEISPDLLLRQDRNRQWVLELNPQSYPHICVNPSYLPNYPQGKFAFKREDRNYINENYGSARWLIKSIRQRGETILRIGSEIVKQQKAFFEYGVSHLRPLVLRDIANATDMHESTVSRVINGKYVASPRGVFELKYFFTVALPSKTGTSVISAAAARHRIKAMIDEESPKAILSDSEIADTLVNEGIDIARRTVAKYREAMGIASSVQRRRQKNSNLARV